MHHCFIYLAYYNIFDISTGRGDTINKLSYRYDCLLHFASISPSLSLCRLVGFDTLFT
jgi:hypothetical protein